MASFTNSLNKGSNFLTGAVGSVANRLSQAGLPLGGIFGRQQKTLQSNAGAPSSTGDWRVKLSLSAGTYGQLFGQSAMMDKEVLGTNNGMVWPVTPFINMSHSANYDTRGLIHNNFPYYAYQNSQVDQITISGSFPVTDQKSGLAWVSTLHFLRTITKMYYGAGANQGNPPPVAKLNGYGDFVYKDVPVIITNFNVELREAVDYIGINVPTGPSGTPAATSKSQGSPGQRNAPSGSGMSPGQRNAVTGSPTQPEESSGSINYVPTDSLIAVTCQPIYSRNKISNKFNLKSFAEGKLAKDGFI